MKKLLFSFAALAVGAGLAATASPAGAAHEGQLRRVYTADLAALNAPGDGEVRIEVFAQNRALVTITADGVTPDGAPHAQHVHMPEAGAATCPTADANDTDGDGIVSVVEGVPAYGSVVTSLTTEGDTSADSALAVERFPVGQDGAYTYERVIDLDPAVARDLANGAVVLHGADFDGSGAYDGDAPSSLDPDLPLEATAPTACGALRLVDIIVPAPYDETAGTEGTITRYYAALLNRAPDESGFAYWTDTSTGDNSADIINAFTQSEEFLDRFGQVLGGDVDEFVEFTYVATLGREPDAGGEAYWVERLTAGDTTREAMVALFADSAEFQALTGTS